MTNQIPFPATTSAQALYPFQYIEETTYGQLITASPSYVPVEIAGDITPTRDAVEIEVGQSGTYYNYASQSAGHDYSFTVDIKPTNIGVMKYGADPITNPQSLQFARAFKRALGTNYLNTFYEYYLGCRVNSLTLTTTARDLASASMEVFARDFTVESQTSGLTTPDFTLFSEITNPVISNVDSDYLPFTFNGTPRAVQNFSITWNNNLARVNLVGSEQGLTEQIVLGHIGVTGSWTEIVGKDTVMETMVHDFPQVAVNAKMKFKAANCFANITGLKITSLERPIPSQPGEPLTNTMNFTAISGTLTTS